MKSDASENVHLDWKGKTMNKDFNDFMNTQDDSMFLLYLVFLNAALD